MREDSIVVERVNSKDSQLSGFTSHVSRNITSFQRSDTAHSRPIERSKSIEDEAPTQLANTIIASGMEGSVRDDSLTVARELVKRLSLEEQISLLAGVDFWRTAASPQHNVPSIKTTDGPNGARGEFFKNGTRAAVFPCGVALAATWNKNLIEEVGRHLADETVARGANVLLGPTICMHRSPLGGRNFESFSEDPLLTGNLAASYIQGLQSKNVAATVKHFVGNEQETNRMTVDSIIDTRALHEIYLRPFEIAVREASPWAVMSSYNRVNGVHADMNHHLLQDILRGQWKFDGLVVSDWTGTNSVTESIKAGCDLEMPGPSQWRGKQAIEATRNGSLSRSDIEACAVRVLQLIHRTKGFSNVAELEERSIDCLETAELTRRCAREGIVLLKNDTNTLPLKDTQKIAVIGPNAERAVITGGGSASLNAIYAISPLDGIRKATNAAITFSQGCDSSKWLPLASEHCKTSDGRDGVLLEYYKGDDFNGGPISVQHKTTTDLFLWDSAPKEVLPAYSFRVKTTIVPQSTGQHVISFSSVGPGRLYINGNLFIDNWNWMQEGEAMFEASRDAHKTIYLKQGRPFHILVESTNEIRPLTKLKHGTATHKYGGCRIGYQEESVVDLVKEAAKAAAEADVAVVCVGLDAEWESEGYDRQNMDLPKYGSQDRLIEAVLAVNPRTVIVIQSGTPVTMPWLHQANTVVQAWYQGQEAGNALADVLFGKFNPCGKLPMTFPKALEDNPSHGNWPGVNQEVVYAEGVFVGYRHYDKTDIEPLFPFGHGLSYTTFVYGAPTISMRMLEPNHKLVVTVPISNTGLVAGHEIVQAYIVDVESSVPRPIKELKAFDKVFVRAGETVEAVLHLDKHSMGFYDDSTSCWRAEAGVFEVLVGASSKDIRGRVQVELTETFTWVF